MVSRLLAVTLIMFSSVAGAQIHQSHESFFREVASDLSATQVYRRLQLPEVLPNDRELVVPSTRSGTPPWQITANGVRRGARATRWPDGVVLDLPQLRVYGAPGPSELCLESPAARGGGASRWVHRVILEHRPGRPPAVTYADKTPYGSCLAVFERGRLRWAGQFSFVFLTEQSLAMPRFHASTIPGKSCPVQYRLALSDPADAFQFSAEAMPPLPLIESCR